MSPSKTAAPVRLLTQAAGERQTGALVVQGHPGGTVYLLEGLIMYAESVAAPGVGELLTASGRLAGRTWQAALDAGTSLAQVGHLLLEQGHLTRGELELCVLGAIYDAAYFALAAPGGPVEFLPGATHWLGPVIRVEPAAVTREARRRARLLDEIFPHPEVDVAPVTPVPRPPVERVTVTALQWELLVHADGQRTPADLALLLGRAGYATIQELRRLAAAGLIERPAPPAADQPDFVRLPGVHPTAVDARRPAAPADTPPVARPAPDPPRHALEPESSGSTGTVYRPPKLTRRKPGAKLPKDVGPNAPPLHTGTDEVLLKRIRTALRALR
ncbi:DUF4388 domain-containing protein [Jidongwangia harbinensis]|uniref:DUF4388 domain-containing protein n=1 Tax=Jidongwangia harbinensis TaxID=2878561 RepID=UPI001CD92D70|nr:DUF4388 domain-containing protein [Jidongwangia harbinensis]MCA2216880.1 ADAM 12 protein [Jidongwangia harbinensis]